MDRRREVPLRVVAGPLQVVVDRRRGEVVESDVALGLRRRRVLISEERSTRARTFDCPRG